MIPVYVEAAQALARRIVREGGTDVASRVRHGLQLCLCRPPRPEQIEPLVALYTTEYERYRNDPAAAMSLATDPLGPASAGHGTGRSGCLDHRRQRTLESRFRLDQRLILMDLDLPWKLQLARAQTRRQFLKTSQAGLGAIALGIAHGGQGPRVAGAASRQRARPLGPAAARPTTR